MKPHTACSFFSALVYVAVASKLLPTAVSVEQQRPKDSVGPQGVDDLLVVPPVALRKGETADDEVEMGKGRTEPLAEVVAGLQTQQPTTLDRMAKGEAEELSSLASRGKRAATPTNALGHHRALSSEPQLAEPASSSQTSSPEPFYPATDLNRAPSIGKLQVYLKTLGVEIDEKQLVDRPIKRVTITEGEDEVDAVLRKLKADNENLQSLSKDNVKTRVLQILDETFGKVVDEVAVHEASLSDNGRVGDPLRFGFNQNTLLYGISESLSRRSNSAKPGFVKEILVSVVNTAEAALTAYEKLIRDVTMCEGCSSQAFRPAGQGEATTVTSQSVDNLIRETAQALGTERKSSSGSYKQTPYDRTFDFDVSLRRGRSSIIPMEYPAIVPGGRFSEFYYWDSYWTLRGLLVGGQLSVANQQIKNFFSLVDRFGFVPNGARQYFLDRSQPPMLAAAVRSMLEALNYANLAERRKDLITEAIPRLLREYFGFWMNPATGHVVTLTSTPKTFSGVVDVVDSILTDDPAVPVLNRYYSSVKEPRPESYAADVAVQTMIDEALENGEPVAAKSAQEAMQSIRAAAESGWDFSTRWSREFIEGKAAQQRSASIAEATAFTQSETTASPETEAPQSEADSEQSVEKRKLEYFKTIDTINVVPVDLNAILFFTENTIAWLLREYKEVVMAESDTDGHRATTQLAHIFDSLAMRRQKTMKDYMFDEKESVYRDWDLKNRYQSRVISAASVVPLWAKLHGSPSLPIPESIIKRFGIVPTPYSGLEQQWDDPNVWAPLVHFAAEYLDRERVGWGFDATTFAPPKGSEPKITQNGRTGFQLARSFLHTAVAMCLKSRREGVEGAFAEKYNAYEVGISGKGGEYPSQLGFGWTNGVVLDFITRYGDSPYLGDFIKTLESIAVFL